MDKKIDCKKIYDKMVEYIKTDLYIYRELPVLMAYLSSDDYGSQLYTTLKAKTAKDCGIPYNVYKIEKINQALNTDQNYIKTIGGFSQYAMSILQLPAINIIKSMYNDICNGDTNDIDGFSFETDIGKKIKQGRINYMIKPATMCAVISILEECFGTSDISGKKIAIVGARSETVGKYLPRELMNKNATVTMLHSKSILHDNIFENYDAVISCVGKAGLIKQRHFGNTVDCVCIDIGVTRGEDGKPKGDFDTDIREYQRYTPYVNGVGLLTRIFLMKNYIMKLKDSRHFLIGIGSMIGINTIKFKEEFLNKDLYIDTLTDFFMYNDDYASLYYILNDNFYKEEILKHINSLRRRGAKLQIKNKDIYAGNQLMTKTIETCKGNMIINANNYPSEEEIENLNNILSFMPYDTITISDPIKYLHNIYTGYINNRYSDRDNRYRRNKRKNDYIFDDEDDVEPVDFDF